MATEDPLDVRAAAALLQADPETVSKLARAGELPGTQIGKGWLFLREDIIAYLRSRIAKDTAERRKHHEQLCVTAVLVQLPKRSSRTQLPALPALSVGKSSHHHK